MQVMFYSVIFLLIQESDAYLKLDPATVAKEILSCHDADKVQHFNLFQTVQYIHYTLFIAPLLGSKEKTVS